METNFRFIQLADPQFGQFSRFSGMSDHEIMTYKRSNLKVNKESKYYHFDNETRLFSKAISIANDLVVSFVVICGDMINTPGNQEEINAVKTISQQLKTNIPIFWVPGNHDVGADTEVPTIESLNQYRKEFGEDYFSFINNGYKFLVINSVVLAHPELVVEEYLDQMKFIEVEMNEAKDNKIPTIVFTHHPLFLDNANEGPMEPEWAPSPPGKAAGYWTIPNPTRSELIDIFGRGNVQAVFAGHWHRNNYARNGKMEMITSGPVGYPLGEDPSGYRLVKINNTQISHSYHKLNQ